jgi:hypothetical protein
VRRVHRLPPFVVAHRGRTLGHRLLPPVPLGGGEVPDSLVRPVGVVVVAEGVQELLEVGEILWGTLF